MKSSSTEMRAYQEYIGKIRSQINGVLAQKDKLELAASWIAESLGNGGFIYTSGTGHSHILAEEIFYRAGGFARVIPILDDALMLHKSASKSTETERKEGYATKLMRDYEFSAQDIFLIASNSGRNTVSIEMAITVKAKGAKVIAITNLKHTESVASRHPSGKKLYEIADLHFDNGGEIGDAAVSIAGVAGKVGATSTVIGSLIMQSMMVQACQILVEKGIVPEVFSSSNSDEGEVHNEALIQKYKGRIKGL